MKKGLLVTSGSASAVALLAALASTATTAFAETLTYTFPAGSSAHGSATYEGLTETYTPTGTGNARLFNSTGDDLLDFAGFSGATAQQVRYGVAAGRIGVGSGNSNNSSLLQSTESLRVSLGSHFSSGTAANGGSFTMTYSATNTGYRYELWLNNALQYASTNQTLPGTGGTAGQSFSIFGITFDEIRFYSVGSTNFGIRGGSFDVVPAVPEPGPVAFGVISSLTLGGMVVRARRKRALA